MFGIEQLRTGMGQLTHMYKRYLLYSMWQRMYEISFLSSKLVDKEGVLTNLHCVFQRKNDVKDIGGELCDVKINLNADDSNDNGHNNHYSHRGSPQIHTNNNRRYGEGQTSNSNEVTNAELHMSMLWKYSMDSKSNAISSTWSS